ncbi:hypothetical protein REPUB_Repub02eG0031100 [Reevesia pubescens]
MELVAAESVDRPYYSTVKVHRLMCLELKKLVDSISHTFPDLESARPGCTLGLQALCSLQLAMDKAKLLIQHCSESSKLYLISGIIDELRSASLSLEPSEYEAGAVILALLEQDISASGSKMQAEIKALRLAALRLSITSPFALLIEQRSIKKLLGKVLDTSPTKRKILNYLLYLLKKHGKLIWPLQPKQSIPLEEESFFSSMQLEQGMEKEDETSPNDFFISQPPEQFKCPLSMRLLYDPVTIASGQTFERFWIEKWFNEGNRMCPVTNTRLEQLSLAPNLAMKGLISKWFLRHGINIPEHAQPIPSLLSLQKSSSSSIASFGSSVLGFQLQMGSVSLGSMSTESSLDSSDGKCNYEITSELPQIVADSHSQRYHHSSMTSSRHDIDAALLSELDKHSWESQCKAVENVKGLLEDTDKARHLTFSSSYITPVIKFFKDANDRRDVKMQKDGAEVLLAILSSSRIEFPPCHEDVIYLLASLLDSEPAGESLALLEVLSWQQCYKSRILVSGVLTSILKVLDTTVTEFYRLALKILRNLSDGSDVGYHIAYLGYIPKLVSFLEDSNVAGYSIEIINNICNIEEVRIEVAEANLFTSITTLLEAGNKEEQELAVDLLLSLCYDNTGYCQMIMTDTIIQSLVSISVNGSSKGSENASELLALLEFMMKTDASQCSINPSTFLSQENSRVSSNGFKVKKSASNVFGCLRCPMF